MTELIDSAEWLGLPAIVVGELWTGFVLGRRREENSLELQKFMASPVVEELSVDSHVARIYAEIVVGLRSAGTMVPTNDVWIAALAARAGATVLTCDDHFASISRVGSLVLPTPA